MDKIVVIRVHRLGARSIGRDVAVSDSAFDKLALHSTGGTDRFLMVECSEGSSELEQALEIIISDTGRVPQRDPLHWRVDEFTIEKRKVFNKRDVEESTLLHLQPSNQCLEIELNDQLEDESLDLPNQKKLDRLKLAADAFAGGPFVISEICRGQLQGSGLRGFSHLPVTVDGVTASPPLVRLSSDVTLPRCNIPLKTVDTVTNEDGEVEVVPFTGDYSRGCHFAIFLALYDGWQLSYRSEALPSLESFDIAVTTERIGNSDSLAFRQIVVSQRFREFSLDQGWRWCKFKPVEITKD